MPKLNDPVRLNLQLFDADPAKYPRAFLYDEAGELLDTIDLIHVANGLYADSSFMMTSTAQIKAVYKVYDDADHENLSNIHSAALDIFELTQAHYQSDSELIGVIEEDNVLTGTINE